MNIELQRNNFLPRYELEVFNNKLKNDIIQLFSKIKKSQNYDLVKQMMHMIETELRSAYKRIYLENEEKRDKTANDTITKSVNTYRENMINFLKDKSFVKSFTFDEYSNEAKKLANKHFTEVFGEEEIDSYTPYLLKVILIII